MTFFANVREIKRHIKLFCDALPSSLSRTHTQHWTQRHPIKKSDMFIPSFSDFQCICHHLIHFLNLLFIKTSWAWVPLNNAVFSWNSKTVYHSANVLNMFVIIISFRSNWWIIWIYNFRLLCQRFVYILPSVNFNICGGPERRRIKMLKRTTQQCSLINTYLLITYLFNYSAV